MTRNDSHAETGRFERWFRPQRSTSNRSAYRFKLALGALLLIMVGLRLGLCFWLQSANQAEQIAHDEHPTIARHLAAGDGFRFNFFGPLEVKPVLTSQQAPLVPFVLAGCYLLFGTATFSAHLSMVLVQIVVSLATVGQLMWLAHLLWRDRRMTLLVGCVSGLYPPLLVSPLHIQALVWNLFWLASMLTATVYLRVTRIAEPSHRQGRRVLHSAIWLGIVGAGGGLTDPILLAPWCMCLMWLLATGMITGGKFSFRRVWGLAKPLGCSGVVLLICLAPWTYRNYVVHGRVVLIKDSFWYVFWQGNNSASVGTDKLLVDADSANRLLNTLSPESGHSAALATRARAISVNGVLTANDVAELFALPTEIERMDWFKRRITAELSANPMQYLNRCYNRLLIWLWFDPTNPRSFLWHYRASYLGLILLAGLGLLHQRARSITGLLALVWCTLAVVHVLMITSARFRILAELLLLLHASLGCSVIVGSFRAWLASWPRLRSTPYQAQA